LRYYEYGVVHRHEKSGVLQGKIRVHESSPKMMPISSVCQVR